MGTVFVILQWGKEKSLVVSLLDSKVIMVTNEHLKYLDKIGLVA